MNAFYNKLNQYQETKFQLLTVSENWQQGTLYSFNDQFRPNPFAH